MIWGNRSVLDSLERASRKANSMNVSNTYQLVLELACIDQHLVAGSGDKCPEKL